MLFSSISFLYYFFAILLVVYFIVPKNKGKNVVLFVASLLFYAYGEPKVIWLLLVSCVVSYYAGLFMEKFPKYRKALLLFAILVEFGFLVYYKYAGFFLDIARNFVDVPYLRVVMPIGISFFTFQTMSYVADVYMGNVQVAHSLLDYSTYVCLFPQLVAGPIVRYSDVAIELETRTHSYDLFGYGVKRFIIGLGKKVLLANMLGELVDVLTGLPVSVLSYWVQAIAYAMQIFFDFAGYSDMAIGLGSIFGFKFPENFNYPFIAKSVTEFWRRWHMTLSGWFRDYVYIPLGGNRVSVAKHIRNILVVWFLTGFWHGANWNYMIWGCYFGGLLLLEKFVYGKYLQKHPVLGWVTTQYLVVISFVIFRQEDLSMLFAQLQGMFSLSIPLYTTEALYYVQSYLVLFVIALFACTPLPKQTLTQWVDRLEIHKVYDVIEVVMLLGLFFFITASLVHASFNPFLYFRF
ncbi:MAG: MBOAT family protein [Erysipelotrichaceae bacterium]|nr:MBOAT family protein [Erysipelotrichaceae bacterium]